MRRQDGQDVAGFGIGDWTFDSRAGELRRGDERRRLEDRTARTLELLCRRRGEVVGAAEIVEAVWGGRALSPNSVAVVIGDLRRALGDDARRPRYIETIAKRGYRLAPAPEATAGAGRAAEREPAPPLTRVRPRTVALAAGLAAALAIGLFLANAQADRRPSVLVRDLTNATGDAGYDALTRASSELVVTDLTRSGGLNVYRSEPGAADAQYDLGGKLTLWNGQASVTLTAQDPVSGRIVWSRVAPGPAAALPTQIRSATEEFADLAAEKKSLKAS